MQFQRTMTFLFCLLALLGCGSDDAAAPTLTLYDGGLEPELSGWSKFSDPLANEFPGTVTVETQAGEEARALRVATDGGAVHFYFLYTGVRTFALAVRVNVISNTANPYDFGLGIAPFVGDPTHDFAALDRAFSLVPLSDRLVWADLTGGSYPLTTAGTHDYLLRFDGSTLTAYVDAPFESVVQGTASAALSRAVSEPSGSAQEGFIGFGDMTNDAGVNSVYEISSVRFAEIPAE
jgi:hypothetical protein